jgi:uncharacterized protein YyaL (SSP411 family)
MPSAKQIAVLLIISGLALIFISYGYEGQNDIIGWRNYATGIEIAKKENKPIFIYIYSDGCIWCRKMNKEVFSDRTVADLIHEMYVPVKVSTDRDSTIALKFVGVFRMSRGSFEIPAYVFMTPEEEILMLESGYMNKEDFKKFIIKTNNIFNSQ